MWFHKIMWSKGDVTYNAQTHQDKLQSYQFGSHRHYDSRDIVVLVYHVIWQDNEIKSSCDL